MNPLMRSVLTFLATNESRHDRTVLAFFISDQFVHFRKWGQIKDGGRLDNLKIYQVAEGIESTDALASSNDATRFVDSSRDKRVMFLGMTLFHYMHVWDQLQQGLRALASFLLSSQGVKSNIWERVLLKPCPWTLWQLPEFIWNKGTRESAPFCCSEANRGLLHNASNLQTMWCDGQFLAKRSAFMVHHVTNRGIWCEWRSKIRALLIWEESKWQDFTDPDLRGRHGACCTGIDVKLGCHGFSVTGVAPVRTFYFFIFLF